jgi:hypothetical protein
MSSGCVGVAGKEFMMSDSGVRWLFHIEALLMVLSIARLWGT